jgi:hypothetical protein
VAGCCQGRNEFSGSLKFWKFLDNLRDYWLLKNEYAQFSCFLSRGSGFSGLYKRISNSASYLVVSVSFRMGGEQSNLSLHL